MMNSFGADRLVKVDLPLQEATIEGHHKVEVWNPEAGDWRCGAVEQIGPDGKVAIRYEDATTRLEWVDLSKERYRWAAASTRN